MKANECYDPLCEKHNQPKEQQLREQLAKAQAAIAKKDAALDWLLDALTLISKSDLAARYLQAEAKDALAKVKEGLK